MKCTYHPEIDAVGACANCGRLICAECKVVLGEKTYCKPCADKLSKVTPISHEASSPNWFQRHLNWTVVLVGVPVSYAAGAICGLLAWLIDPYGLYITVACPPKIGSSLMRDSCKITTGGSKSENKKVFGGAGIPGSARG